MQCLFFKQCPSRGCCLARKVEVLANLARVAKGIIVEVVSGFIKAVAESIVRLIKVQATSVSAMCLATW